MIYLEEEESSIFGTADPFDVVEILQKDQKWWRKTCILKIKRSVYDIT